MLVKKNGHTHSFEVFDEEITQPQIMTDLLRWKNVKLYMGVGACLIEQGWIQAELNFISKYKSYLRLQLCGIQIL